MRLLSDLLGLPVVDSDGRARGHINDLITRLRAPHPVVTGLLVAVSHRDTRAIPWETVNLAGTRVELSQPPDDVHPAGEATTLDSDEILLGHDLLDTQIIDLSQHRVARVGDVVLEDLPDSVLEVVAVEVGGRAVLRRLGLRSLARRLPEQVVDFADLHLVSSRGHAAQVRATTAPLHRLDARGLADLVTRLDLESATDVLAAVGPAQAAKAVDAVHPVVRARLLSAMKPSQIDSLTAASRGSRAEVDKSVASHVRHRLRGRLSRHRGWRLHSPLHDEHDADGSTS
jgi:sporulation protein YlmC with PRC-barrel domain